MDKKIYKDIIIIIFVTVCMFTPFINKAYHIDDTLFLRSAEQILKNPLRPYDVMINWFGIDQSLFSANKNPPLVSYILAFLGKIGGFGEKYIHTVFSLFPLGGAIFMYLLARKLSGNALFITLLLIASPCFWVSGTNIMCDSALLFFALGSVLFYINGEEKGNAVLILLSMIFLGCAALTKYIGVGFIPLLIIYQILRKRRYYNMLYFLIPIGIFWLWNMHGYRCYGMSHFLISCLYKKPAFMGELMAQLTLVMIYISACLVSPIIYSLRLDKLHILSLAFGILIYIVAYPYFIAIYKTVSTAESIFIIILTWFSIYIIFKSAENPGIAKEPLKILTYLWFYGMLVFITLFNWTVAARNILIMAPPALFLYADSNNKIRNYIALAAVFIISFMVTSTDYDYANIYKDFAKKVRKHAPYNEVYFVGHWGFQYYMEREGYKPIREGMAVPKEGYSFIVVPTNVSNMLVIDQSVMKTELLKKIVYDNRFGVILINSKKKAGFYSTVFGMFPYVFLEEPLEEFSIYKFTVNTGAVK